MASETTLILTAALAVAGVFCCIVATAVFVLTPAGRGRRRAERDAFSGLAVGVALMGIAYLLQG